jgi:2-methylisocitrate lyase-like PEP mutase family enzyme
MASASKMAEALGYDVFSMSGGNTSAHQLGWPDSGTSMRDMVGERARSRLSSFPPLVSQDLIFAGHELRGWPACAMRSS